MNLKPFAFSGLLAWVALTGLACVPQGAATAETNPSPIEASEDGTLGGSPTPVDLENEGAPLSDQVSGGDAISSEVTLSQEAGVTSTMPPPLGELKPARGLLPSGTISVTLNLTTTAPADCRWVEEPDTPYDSMPHEFELGQGTALHSTVVRDFSDLGERRFYVRCRDRTGARDPDHLERATHLRVLGPWESGYPRIARLWGNNEHSDGADLFAGYDLIIPYSWSGGANLAAAIRALNPKAKILLTQNATYGWPEEDALTAEWWDSRPGEPGYNCLLRDSSGEILLVDYWAHAMYNMTQPYCRALLAQRNVNAFLSPEPGQGDELTYDGIYWDRLHGTISWLGDDIDSDLDDQPDDPDVLDTAYQAGVEDFLKQVRVRLPRAILVGNEAPQAYTPWVNGRVFEWQLREILDGTESLDWASVVTEYRDWAGHGPTPHTTFIQSMAEGLYEEKYPFRHSGQIPPAIQDEAAASYRRMRYGLTSALMGDGLFSYDLRPVEAPPPWYDEFGASGNDRTPTLPSHGYLGQPTGDPALLLDTLSSPDQISNGGFEADFNGWSWGVDTGSGAAATIDIDPSGGVSGTAAAHMLITSQAHRSSVKLYQTSKTTMAGQGYTLSFWARSDVTRTLYAKIAQGPPPGIDYGFFVEALVTPQWQRFRLWDDADATASDGELALQVGEAVGELWLDDVQLQAGALGVWARPFENGLAVINTTREVQTVPLPGIYWKLEGSQAPLFQTRVDDDEARVLGGWNEQEADYDQFGKTVHKTTAGTADTIATAIYTPTLAYSGTYEVLAWVVPSVTQSSRVSVTIRHALGETVVLLDQTDGQVGWHSLGTYPFSAGEEGSAILAATGNGIAVADAFKWESTARFNDGNQVSRVTLQPQDGIVLLSSPSLMTWQMHLPAVLR